jgi:hypothetical protein
MHLSRGLVLSFLITLCVATVAAQSAPSPDSSQLLPTLTQNAEVSTDLFQFQLPADSDLRDLSDTALNIHEHNSVFFPPADSLALHILTLDLTLDQNRATCYTIRTYRVARENPDSDVVRPVAYSTCQRATRFQFRTAVDSREITPR